MTLALASVSLSIKTVNKLITILITELFMLALLCTSLNSTRLLPFNFKFQMIMMDQKHLNGNADSNCFIFFNNKRKWQRGKFINESMRMKGTKKSREIVDVIFSPTYLKYTGIRYRNIELSTKTSVLMVVQKNKCHKKLRQGK